MAKKKILLVPIGGKTLKLVDKSEKAVRRIDPQLVAKKLGAKIVARAPKI